MNSLTLLIFILGLGSLNCFDGWVDTTPEISDECSEKEKVGEKDLKDMDDMNVKCYYHCVYEKQGIIANGVYKGSVPACKGVTDANKCELATKVVSCSLPK
ncbi:general odorant-binding protein 56h-like [Drosophila serrata]|uniref:general odorant-binding protein 56h-like n=1 Tax=Drosophila serrata TaxID=7274 RepID=UPI000A1D0041|nr:general odorant-binding protein 56h-like [Drosophila serrata]